MTDKTVAERAAAERYVEGELNGEIEKATEVCNSRGVSGWAYDFLRVCAALAQTETKLTETREEIKKLEDEILDCPADSAYHASLKKDSHE